MSIVGTIILLVLLVFVIFGPRRWALLGMAAGILYLTQFRQSIDVFGFAMHFHRFLELAAIGRVMLRREFRLANLNKIDRTFLLLYLYVTVVFALRSSEGLTYQIGIAVDAMFSYFAFRGLIASIEDFKWFLRRLVMLMIPFVILVIIEHITYRNWFSIVGSNFFVQYYREGSPRCTGSFRHAILMGSFGASFLPLYVGLILEKIHKNIAIAGAGICLGIVLLSNSGGPATAVAIGLAGWGLWRFRKKMHMVKIGMFFSLIFLVIFMKAPIWSLPFKISKITGGGGYHRYYLIEMAIQNFSQWWLAGMPMENTRDWFPYMLAATGGADITNHFISFGIKAGIIAILIFVVLLIKSFRVIGEEMANTKIASRPRPVPYFIWGIGVMLLVHISNWFGVTYYDQMKLVWYMQLALIAMLADKEKGISKMKR